jgi:hypothetical protein
MKDYSDKIKIAECIVQEAIDYIDHKELSAQTFAAEFYEDIDELELAEEDTDLYRIRLDCVFYREQF